MVTEPRRPVLDLSGRTPSPALRLEATAAFELLMTLCAFCLPEDEVATLDTGDAWTRQVTAHASPELLTSIERTGKHAGKAWVNLVGLAARPPVTERPAELIERVERLSALDVRLYLLGEHVPAYRGKVDGDTLRRAADGDAAAKERLLCDPAYFSGEADPILRPLLGLGVDETKALALDVLRRWSHEVFAPLEDEVAATLRAEAERHRASVETGPVERAIEDICGIRFVPNAAIGEVVLVPQLAMRPWLLLCEHDGTRLFCYPAAEAGADGASAVARLLQIVRALGDERRLSMLAALAEEGGRVQRLSRRFGLPKSTTYHHLAILRAAGLVTVTSDLERRYRVRAEALRELDDLLDRVLGPRDTTTTDEEER